MGKDPKKLRVVNDHNTDNESLLPGIVSLTSHESERLFPLVSKSDDNDVEERMNASGGFLQKKDAKIK